MLELSRLVSSEEPLPLAETDLGLLCAERLPIPPELSQNPSVEYILKGGGRGTCVIPTNETYMTRVIDNLLQNAAKFTATGSITVCCEKDDRERRFHILVADTGIGIAPDKMCIRDSDKFGVNLTQMARECKIDPVVGREQEIERVVQILSRRKKNNPILIGEAGVGKSAIIEGLALRIAGGEVPYTIADKTLFSLDVSSVSYTHLGSSARSPRNFIRNGASASVSGAMSAFPSRRANRAVPNES